jgi:hypothetical protein
MFVAKQTLFSQYSGNVCGKGKSSLLNALWQCLWQKEDRAIFSALSGNVCGERKRELSSQQIQLMFVAKKKLSSQYSGNVYGKRKSFLSQYSQVKFVANGSVLCSTLSVSGNVWSLFESAGQNCFKGQKH